MRLIEIQIKNVRGHIDTIIRADGKNLVIWGPNGSGKSGVVDAIDFLLTGKIERLSGDGTGGITLSKHGPHVDKKEEDLAEVKAIILVPGYPVPIEISRNFKDPATLCYPEHAQKALTPILEVADRGQYVLTRRDILKYITAGPNDRLKQIQEILKLNHVEEIRKALVKARNDLKNEERSTAQSVRTAQGAVNSTIQSSQYNPEKVRLFVNEQRVKLGGSPLDTLDFRVIKDGLIAPKQPLDGENFNVKFIERDIVNLEQMPDDALIASEARLRHIISELNCDIDLLKAYSRLQLTKLGADLLDDAGECPLCDYPWPVGELEKKFRERLEKGGICKEYYEEIDQISTSLTTATGKAIASIKTLISAAEHDDRLRPLIALFQERLSLIIEFQQAIGEPQEKYLSFQERYPIKNIFDPTPFLEGFATIRAVILGSVPEISEERLAWDSLTRLEENLKGLANAEALYSAAAAAHTRANILHDSYISASTHILSSLYQEISGRLAELYSDLHDDDENDFRATLAATATGLLLEVDFHGRGSHPPHALHSEGHQDSMGLCLYLALSEKLVGGVIDLVVLDDVVMSVDAGHRKALCRVLATKFADKQFLITTHDKIWCTQLRTEGVVTRKGVIEFSNWHVQTGPVVSYDYVMWDKIDAALARDDVPEAAFILRRNSEQFFAYLCDKLHAKITFKLSGEWELGEYLPAAYLQYKELINMAKKAANSWAQAANVTKLNELDSVAGQIYLKSQVSQWGVNASVHYNQWKNLSKQDFQPIIDAFKDLHGLFLCSKCERPLYVAQSGNTLSILRCNCGEVHWNLQSKATS